MDNSDSHVRLCCGETLNIFFHGCSPEREYGLMLYSRFENAGKAHRNALSI